MRALGLPKISAPGPRATGYLARMWRRRLFSIPLLILLCNLWTGLLPLLLPLALLVDLLRWRRFAATRTLFFFGTYLWAENLGILASAAIWLLPATPPVYLARNYALQSAWNKVLFDAGRVLYGMKIELHWEDPAEEVGRRPLLLLPRHVSTADTVLPVGIFSAGHGIRLRFVLKEELLWDPCLDIVGNRVPNCFVRRARTGKTGTVGAAEQAEKIKATSAAELQRVAQLGRGMGPGDGVLIYPEGTRFTEGKRRALLEKASPELRGRVERFRQVLPPVPGGTLALLDATLPGVDIWFCGHVGYEAAGSFRELINGGLIGKVVRIHLWKRRGEDVPAEPAARLDWLDKEWERMDRWVQSVSPDPKTG